jgi:hypothetical protein
MSMLTKGTFSFFIIFAFCITVSVLLTYIKIYVQRDFITIVTSEEGVESSDLEIISK